MFLLFTKIVFFSNLVCICYSVLIEFEYLRSNTSDFLSVEIIDVLQPEIKSDLLYEKLKYNTIKLKVNTYSQTQSQLELISNLPQCDSIILSSSGQRLIPVFKNLPVIRRISIDSNFLTYIKKDSFDTLGVEIINLDQNSIATIEEQSFGLKVRKITLRCNKIDKFSKSWFQNYTSLEEITLTGNEIRTIEENQFKDFINLKRIYLDHNSITKIGNGAFSNRNNFKSLNLNYNQIKQFSTNIFASEPVEFEELLIAENLLTFLTRDFRQKVKVTLNAVMSGNPWQCACYEEIRKWIDPDVWSKGAENQARCVVPILSESLLKHCIPYFDQEIIDYYLEHERGQDPPNAPYCKNKEFVNN